MPLGVNPVYLNESGKMFHIFKIYVRYIGIKYAILISLVWEKLDKRKVYVC